MKSRDTFRIIYEEHKVLVYNLALNYVQNSNDAEEITQDVFLKVYQNLGKFEQRSSVKTWIYRIAVNKSLDFLKERKARKRFSLITSLFRPGTNEPIDEVSGFHHPGVALEDKEAVRNIFMLINKLPERQKTVIILSKLEGRSQQEIAEIMQTGVKAVESLLQRAKSTLSQQLTLQNEGNPE
jgi:RNA polymerase sigma factor (sigma-70 family)